MIYLLVNLIATPTAPPLLYSSCNTIINCEAH